MAGITCRKSVFGEREIKGRGSRGHRLSYWRPHAPGSSEMCDIVQLTGRRDEDDYGFRVPLGLLAFLVCHQLKQSPAPGHTDELPHPS